MLSGIGKKASMESKQHQFNMFHGETFLYVSGKSKMFIFKHSKLNIDFILLAIFGLAPSVRRWIFHVFAPLLFTFLSLKAAKQ